MHDLFGSVDNVADFVRITKTCCIRHSIGTLNQYMDGKKHCRRCETYFYYNGLFCPCYGMQLRLSPTSTTIVKTNSRCVAITGSREQ